jgi:site-specific DNA-methyltransferase (adenine-specific)
MPDTWKNQLFFGDNLDLLQQLYAENPQGYIDLIYIDPPFNSKRNYNVLFESVDLKDATAQKEAFADTWSNVSYVFTLNQLADLDFSLHSFIKNLDSTNISKGAISYLTTMAVRLWYMHKVLKPNGSFYLHCDSTMSHYLKIICDLIFGEKGFVNEIIWSNETASGFKSQAKNKFIRGHDIIFFYTKGKPTFNIQYLPLSESTKRRYDKVDNEGKKYKIYVGNDGTERIVYLEKSKGRKLSDTWTDIPSFQTVNASREWMGYDTQKPEALLDRIIKTSSNEGDLIADFFCGCGTSIAVAQKLNRRWIGVDISHLAINLISKRLEDSYGVEVLKTFEIHGFPKDIESARALANDVKGGRLEFEEWIVEILLHGVVNERRNEMGFDGYRTFSIYDKKYIVMIEVKSGSASPTQVNHFINTVKDRGGAMGLFICFADEITKNMQLIVAKEGQFSDDFGNTYGNRFQIISVEELMEGKRPNIPLSKVETFKKAEKKIEKSDSQIKLEL